MIDYATRKDLDPQTVRAFYHAYADWLTPVELSDWARMLEYSAVIISAWDGKKLVGMARAISDHVRWATILEVLVDTGYRRQGIGSELVTRLVNQPALQVRTVYLGTENARSFYQKLGFRRVNDVSDWMLLIRNEYARGYHQTENGER